MDKAPDAFRTISEVADDLDVPQHVLRFWETRFAQIRPMKRAGGRRYYRTDDIDLLRGIRHLLYGQGYTIRGVQRLLKDNGSRFVQSIWRPDVSDPPDLPSHAPDVIETAHLTAGADLDDETESPETENGAGVAYIQGAPGAADAEAAALPIRRTPEAQALPVEDSSISRMGLSERDRENLAAVLTELTACRGVLDAALAAD